MKRSRLAFTLAPVLAFAASARAQDIFISSSTSTILTRALDQNANGNADDVGEYTKAAWDPSGTFLKSGWDIKATSLFGPPGLLWVDNATSTSSSASKQAIIALVDTNGNGVFEPSEIAMAFDFKAATGVTAANTFLGGIAEDAGGVVYLANSRFKTVPLATDGIYRITGLAGVPAFTMATAATDAVTVYENATTPGGVIASSGTFNRLAMHTGSATLYGYNTKDDCIYAMRDLNADGKFTGAGEIVNFVNFSGHRAGLATSGDLFGGGLAFYGTMFNSVTASVTGNFGYMNMIEVDQVNGDVWIGTNAAITTLSGSTAAKIFRCRDLNGNGTCNDAGEVTLWLDGSTLFPAPPFETSPGSGVFYPPAASPGFTGLGVDSTTHKVFALSNSGPLDPSSVFSCDTVWELTDLNADGDANDPGEQILANVQKPNGSFSFELEIVPAGLFNPAFPSMSNFFAPGDQSPIVPNPACVTTPTALALKTGIRFYESTPYLGNPLFTVSVTGTSYGGPVGDLWFSEVDFDPFLMKQLFDYLNTPAGGSYGLPYPSNLSSIDMAEWFAFVPFFQPAAPCYLDIMNFWGTTGDQFTAPAIGDVNASMTCSNGTTQVPYVGRYDAYFFIPNVPALAGKDFRLQWHTLDSSTGWRVLSDLGIVRIN